jgi:hypothetical protein
VNRREPGFSNNAPRCIKRLRHGIAFPSREIGSPSGLTPAAAELSAGGLVSASMRGALALFLFLFVAVAAQADSAPLLQSAVERWLGERDHWAFTQRAVEYNRDGTTYERLERYDPSLVGNARWKLLAIDGKSPTSEQRAAWEKKKFKKNRRRFDSPLGEYFDFDRAKIVSEDSKTVRFTVPLRNDKNWLFPTDKVDVAVAINKETRALEHLEAKVREPFRVLLGIARVTNGAIDLTFDDAADAAPTAAQPNGTARVSVFRFGERVDFEWTDFKRVTPADENSAAVSKEP